MYTINVIKCICKFTLFSDVAEYHEHKWLNGHGGLQHLCLFHVGSPGNVGVPGFTGEAGFSGPAGNTGASGIAGAVGLPGTDGVQGIINLFIDSILMCKIG